MRMWLFLPACAALLVLGILGAGCVNGTPGDQNPAATPQAPPQPQPPGETPPAGMPSAYGEAKTVVGANDQFAFDMYTNLRSGSQNQESNIFFSPFSVSSALALTYEGARGKTADEIASVLHVPKNDTLRRQQFRDINAGINTKDPSYTLDTANALWAEKTYTFLPDYLETAREFYSADATNLDFITAPDVSRGTINTWVAGKTGGKIAGLLPRGSIIPSTRLVITNAVYFYGFWKYPFLASDTRPAKFTVSPGTVVDVSMMTQTNETLLFNYMETNSLQMVEMPYTHTTGKELSMLVILPRGDNMSVVENSLDAGQISGMRDALRPRLVDIYIPKFRLDTQYDMGSSLKTMGMPTAFSGQSDFSGMDGSRNLSISTVIHKAYVDVDEKGTQATAATVVGMVAMGIGPRTPPVPVIFRADHPFLFMIEDRESGNILFMGRVMNPNA